MYCIGLGILLKRPPVLPDLQPNKGPALENWGLGRNKQCKTDNKKASQAVAFAIKLYLKTTEDNALLLSNKS